jgi:hypothetical protein
MSERKEPCCRCGSPVSDWVDPDWSGGRICRPCESKYEPKEMNEAKDISTEQRRTYTWPDGSKVTIEEPAKFIDSQNGHRISDSRGNGHYVPKGWIHLQWENKHGAPAIVA